jgi:hypothetical protein
MAHARHDAVIFADAQRLRASSIFERELVGEDIERKLGVHATNCGKPM